jgi:hypothetical protein
MRPRMNFGSCAYLSRDDPSHWGAIGRRNSGQCDYGHTSFDSSELKEILIYSLKAF